MLNLKVSVLSELAFDNGCAIEKFNGPTIVYQSILKPVEALIVELSKELS